MLQILSVAILSAAPKSLLRMRTVELTISVSFIFQINLGRTWKNKQADNILANSTREPLVLDGKLPLQHDLELDETNSLDFSSSIQVQVASTWLGYEMLGRVCSKCWKATPQNSPMSSIGQNILL